MRKIVLSLLALMVCMPINAQNPESFLHVDDFSQNSRGVLKLPEGMKKTDNNGKPWAAIEIVSSGFDGSLLSDLSVYSSSTLKIGYAGYNEGDQTYNLILSSDVKGSLTIKYQGATLNYKLPFVLSKNKVYTLRLVMRSANLTILATPTDAKIYVDGQEVGNGGYASVDLRIGEHVYSVECEDYLAEKNKIIKLYDNERIFVNLQPLFGYITINSDPEGADVFIDGTRVGVTPYFMREIKRGKHNVELQLNGYYSYGELVDIGINEEKDMNVSLIAYGSVSQSDGVPKNLTLRLSEDSLFFDSGFVRDSIFVSTNNIEWNFNDAPRWLSLYRRNNILYITCSENYVHESREADIEVYTGDLTRTLHVYQDVGKAILKTRINALVFESDEDTLYRVIETNVYGWDITTSDKWINAYEKNDTLVVICSKNNTPVSRYGTISVKAFGQEMDFNVSQKSHITKISVPKEDIIIEADGGSLAIPINNHGDSWTCYSDVSWLDVSRSGNNLLIGCEPNSDTDRNGSFIIKSNSKSLKIKVIQKGEVSKQAELKIESYPSNETVFVDGKKIGKTPIAVLSDNSLHSVKKGQEQRYCVFNANVKSIRFETGLRYIQGTVSSNTFGLRSGFIGSKRWGGYNHLQMNIEHCDFNPDIKTAPLYMYSMGPSFEIFPWMSVYAGAGMSLTTDTLVSCSSIVTDSVGNLTYKNNIHSKLNFGLMAEAGLMFYYRNFVLSGGIQMTNIGKEQSKVDYSVGLGLYFSRFYTQKDGYCATKSRQWWSLNYVFNPVRKGHGIMFNDIGRGSVRPYIKAMVELPFNDEIYMGISSGIAFNTIPGYIDLMVGGGLQGYYVSKEFGYKGLQAEFGFVLNLWRFPIGVMLRYCDLEKDTRYLTFDFSVGFSFGKTYKNK